MTFTLHVDGDRWRAHPAGRATTYARRHQRRHAPPRRRRPRARGQGQRLRRWATRGSRARPPRLGLTRLAVGTVFEAARRSSGATTATSWCSRPFEPSRPRRRAACGTRSRHGPHADRVVRTVSVARGLGRRSSPAPGRRAWCSRRLTSMGRFGLTADELALLLADDATVAALAQDRVRARGPRAAPAARAAEPRPPRRPGRPVEGRRRRARAARRGERARHRVARLGPRLAERSSPTGLERALGRRRHATPSPRSPTPPRSG